MPLDLYDIIKTLALGVVEGLTEFLPVSSTGHLLLFDRFFGFASQAFADKAFADSFMILIQLGAILAIVVIYFQRLWSVALGMFTDPAARHFVIGLLLAFLPAVVIGVLAYHFIKEVLFNPWVVCFTLIAGGAVLLWIDQLDLRPRYHDSTKLPLGTYLVVGVCQCAAMIPGVSRSGATIVSAMLLGVDKRAAAEFSFFLAIPTMLGAFVYDFYKNHSHLTGSQGMLVALGFVVSFVVAWIVVKSFLAYVTRHGFALFAWWRVVVGALGLVGLALGK